MNRTTLLLLAVTLSIASTTKNNDVNIIPIKTPLLPFHLGNARVIESKHTFLHFVEISPLIIQLNSIERFYSILEKSLIKPPKVTLQSTHYINPYNLINHAQYLISQLRIKLNNIKPHYRSKRGLINAGGKISKWLFGTLDSDDGEKFDTAINELHHNQNSYKKEIGLQISLTKQLIDNYNNTITLLNKNQQNIKNHIDAFELNLNKTIMDISTFLRVQNTLLQVILNCQSFITFLDNLEDAIMFAKLNTLHSAVISASQLEQIIFNLTTLYGDDKVLIFKNLDYYYQLAGLQVSFVKDKIIFAIHLPIFIKDSFEIFHLLPIPINQSIFIPNLSYLILGTDLQQYQDQACPAIEDLYICENQLKPQIKDCVTTLIKEAVSQDCGTTKVEISAPIIHSITNQYILAIPSNQELKVHKICENKEIIFVESPSLINIPINCGIRIQNTQFWNTEETIKGSPFYLPPIKLNEFKPRELDQEPIRLQSIDLNKIKNLQEQARALKIPTTNPGIHPVTWSITTSLSILLIITLILYAVWQIYKKRRPSPKPRNQSTLREPTPENNPASLLFSTSTGGVMIT